MSTLKSFKLQNVSKDVRLAKSSQKETTSNNLLSTTRNLIRTLKQKLHQKYVNATQKSKENYSHDKLGCIPFCRQISEDVKGKSSKDCWTQSKENQFQEFYLDTYLDT